MSDWLFQALGTGGVLPIAIGDTAGCKPALQGIGKLKQTNANLF